MQITTPTFFMQFATEMFIIAIANAKPIHGPRYDIVVYGIAMQDVHRDALFKRLRTNGQYID